jgi:multiple sugar transport system substrate-binding protein
MIKRLLTATSIAVFCLASSAAAAEKVEMWVRTGIGDAFKKTVEAYNTSHENQVAMTEVPFSELVQKYATAIAGG